MLSATVLSCSSQKGEVVIPADKAVEAKVEQVAYAETIDVIAVCVPRVLGQIKEYIEGYTEQKEEWE